MSIIAAEMFLKITVFDIKESLIKEFVLYLSFNFGRVA